MAIGDLNIAGGLEAYPIGSIYMSFNPELFTEQYLNW